MFDKAGIIDEKLGQVFPLKIISHFSTQHSSYFREDLCVNCVVYIGRQNGRCKLSRFLFDVKINTFFRYDAFLTCHPPIVSTAPCANPHDLAGIQGQRRRC